MASRSLTGRKSLFRRKRRAPVSLTLTEAHHEKITRNVQRVGLSRSDFIGLLIEKYSDTVPHPSEKSTESTAIPDRAYKRLRDAVEALGGTLEHHKRDQPRGGAWVLRFGGKELTIPSEQAKRFPALDACYQLKPGVTISRTWQDHEDTIEPAGLADLFARLAKS